MKTLLVYSELSGFAIQIKNHIYDALQELAIESRECYIEDVEKVSKEFQPTMHIFLHHARKLYEYKDVIKGLGGHKLLWTMEDPYESDVTFDMLDTFYYVFTSDENTAKELEKAGISNHIEYVPHACNPKVHRPMEVSYEYKSDILFVGNAYESRLKWFSDHKDEYKDKMVTIVGVGYRGLDGYQYQRVVHGHISEPEMVKYINGAKLVLNLHRQNSDLDMANKRGITPTSLNNRFYEIAACGKQQLIVGRGNDNLVTGVPENFHANDSYKQRLVKYYLPLLK